MKMYKKMREGDEVVTVRVDGVFKGLEAEKIFKMQTDLKLKVQMSEAPAQVKLVEQVSANTDVIYLEIALPFPLANRDFVQKRLYVGNKEDPELVKKLGLYDWSHKYYAFLSEATERPEYPPKSKLVRAETKMNYWIFEEDPNEKGTVKVRLVTCQKLNGNIPNVMINKATSSIKKTMIEPIFDSYKKIFGVEITK